jgi:FKBP-type peptidyl-prolyl cis-trans isomerase
MKELSKNEWIAVTVGIFAIGFFFVFGQVVMNIINPNATKQMNSQLQIQDELVGTGEVAKAGDILTVHYTGKLPDGTTFDSSYNRNEPFRFTLGAGMVIKGWDEGMVGMKVGGKRILIVPPDYGYGENGVPGVIPGNSTLIFEVELLKISNSLSE